MCLCIIGLAHAPLAAMDRNFRPLFAGSKIRNPCMNSRTKTAEEKNLSIAMKKQKSQSTKKHSPAANFPAFLFDLDGTLIDSNYQHVQTWSQALREADIDIPVWKIHRRIGMSGTSFLSELLREVGIEKSKEEIDALDERHGKKFEQVIGEIAPLPGANELLSHLQRNQIRMAIATTSQRKHTQLLLKKLRIPDSMPVVNGDDVEKAKPSPDIFVAAAEKLGVDLSDCIVVGDSVWDLLAAGRKHALGVGLLSGGYGMAELQSAGAFRVYEDAADLLMHIEQLGLPGRSV